jgi:hypothetical protein
MDAPKEFVQPTTDDTATAVVTGTEDGSSKLVSKPIKRRGRSDRRRRKRLRELEQSEQELFQNNSLSIEHEETKPSFPLEQEHVWQQNVFTPLSDRDQASLRRQLGYLPGNCIVISCRLGELQPKLKANARLFGSEVADRDMESDVPLVIQLYPLVSRVPTANPGATGIIRRARTRRRHALDDNPLTLIGDLEETPPPDIPRSDLLIEPFPTMFWLTHPLLRVLISRLEVSGLGKRLEERLATAALSATTEGEDKDSYLAQMQRAHAAYGTERFQLLTPSDLVLLEERSWTSALDASRGVAGTNLDSKPTRRGLKSARHGRQVSTCARRSLLVTARPRQRCRTMGHGRSGNHAGEHGTRRHATGASFTIDCIIDISSQDAVDTLVDRSLAVCAL